MSKKIKYNKLVRDRIPNILIKQNKAFKCKHLETDTDLQTAVACKVLEEAKEVCSSAQNLAIKGEVTNAGTPLSGRKNELVNEVADLMEVTFALMKSFHITAKQVTQAMEYKAKERGKFNDGIYLEWVEEED